jgi:hypothetical protein
MQKISHEIPTEIFNILYKKAHGLVTRAQDFLDWFHQNHADLDDNEAICIYAHLLSQNTDAAIDFDDKLWHIVDAYVNEEEAKEFIKVGHVELQSTNIDGFEFIELSEEHEMDSK